MSHSAGGRLPVRPVGAWLLALTLAAASCSSTSSAHPGTNSGQPTTSPSSVPLTAPEVTVGAATTATSSTPTTLTVAAAGLSEGRWTAVGLMVGGQPTVTATLIPGRPGGGLTAVARINAAVTRPVLYAGTVEPGGAWPAQGAIAGADRAGLVAAFNSGFHTYSAGGGWFDHGRMAVPLRTGAASLVIHADGSATVGMWGRDASMTADVVSVRQNLDLLVDGGMDRSTAGSWGAVLGGGNFTWRSGLGVDSAGDLLYAGGPGLDASTLARVLIDAGALRAMELDINPQWVAFAYYPGATTGADLLAGMRYGPSHWLSGSARDFIAVVTR